MHGTDEKYVQSFGRKDMRMRDYLGGLDVHGKVVL